MSTRINHDVLLTHEDACRVAKMLSDYADKQGDHARRTRSALVQRACQAEAIEAGEMAMKIGRQLTTWTA